MPWCGRGDTTPTMPRQGIAGTSRSSGGSASSASSNNGSENCRPPSRMWSTSPVSTGSPPPADITSCATTVTGPLVSTRAENVRRRPGTRTGNAARNTGRRSEPCDSPKSVYGNSQASAKTEHDGLTGDWGSHDLDVEIEFVDFGDQSVQRRGRGVNSAVLAHRNPQAGPALQVDRTDHEITVPATTRAGRGINTDEDRPRPAHTAGVRGPNWKTSRAVAGRLGEVWPMAPTLRRRFCRALEYI